MSHFQYPSIGLVAEGIDPLVAPLSFTQVGIAVSNIEDSIEFYYKIGFDKVSGGKVPVLVNKGGLELHLFQSDGTHDDDKNILNDLPDRKIPGHTHVCFTVPSVSRTKEYLESVGIPLSGERKSGPREDGETLASIFCRDLDRTTLEFEIHGTNRPGPVTRDEIGYPQGMDHVGVRVSSAPEAAVWYAEKLGFVEKVMTYDLNPEPLKNFAPHITRSESLIDINFIPNANEKVTENALLAGGRVRPGIVFVGLGVEDVASAEQKLAAAGVTTVRDEHLSGRSEGWRLLADRVVTPAPEAGGSLFLMDPDFSLLRLVAAKKG